MRGGGHAVADDHKFETARQRHILPADGSAHQPHSRTQRPSVTPGPTKKSPIRVCAPFVAKPRQAVTVCPIDRRFQVLTRRRSGDGGRARCQVMSPKNEERVGVLLIRVRVASGGQPGGLMIRVSGRADVETDQQELVVFSNVDDARAWIAKWLTSVATPQ
jgi:hypothetical protein